MDRRDIVRELGLSDRLPKAVIWGVLVLMKDDYDLNLNVPAVLSNGEYNAIGSSDRLVIYNNGEIIFNELITNQPDQKGWRNDKNLFTPFLDQRELGIYQESLYENRMACIIRFM